MKNPLLMLDYAISRLFRPILNLLVNLTGQDNLLLAKATMTAGASIIIAASVLEPIEQNRSAGSVLEAIIFIILVAVLYAKGINGYIEVYSQPPPDGLPAVDSGIIFIRLGAILFWIPLQVFRAIHYRSVYLVVFGFGYLVFCAGLYFLTEHRPKRISWVRRLARKLTARPAPQTSPT